MLPNDAFAVVMVVIIAAHTAVVALEDGFDAFFEDVHAQVDAGIVGVGEIGSEDALVKKKSQVRQNEPPLSPFLCNKCHGLYVGR